jgi:hypothetical protein
MNDYQQQYRSNDPWEYRTFNPATGLPMVGPTVDAGGNPYGADLSPRTAHDEPNYAPHNGSHNPYALWVAGCILAVSGYFVFLS